MNPFSTAELAAMQAAQVSSLQDRCLLQTRTVTVSDLGHPTETWSAGLLTPCGFDPTGGEEIAGTGHTTILTEASVRLSLDTTVTIHDRIVITVRYGVPVANVAYEIVSPPEIGPSGIVVRVKKVEI